MRFALDVCKLIKQLSHSEPSQTVRRHNQLSDYQITQSPDRSGAYPFSTGRCGSDDHSDHDPA
jgi:hypothetical protein